MYASFYVSIAGYLLGLSLAAPPGPVNAIIMNESSKSAFHGASVGAGAMTADAIFLVVLYFVKDSIPHWIFKYLYIVGAAYMLFLATSVLRAKMPSRSQRGNYLVGISVGITNPFQIVWWVTVGLFLIEKLTFISVLFFFLGIATWITVFPITVYRFGRDYTNVVKFVSFSVLVAFSALMIFYALQYFFPFHGF
ncbi:MAG: LysE family transporter [Thermoplasmatales archaeon]